MYFWCFEYFFFLAFCFEDASLFFFGGALFFRGFRLVVLVGRLFWVVVGYFGVYFGRGFVVRR